MNVPESDTQAEPQLTTVLELHMTGEGFRIRVDNILADGKPTDFIKRYKTGGPPDYEYLAHELVFRAGKDDEEFLDLLDPNHEPAEAWVRARL